MSAEAGTKRNPGYPLGEFDAKKWAEEFDRIFPDSRPDTDTMLGWFANAIMTGYDRAANQSAGTLDEAWKAAEAALPDGWLFHTTGPWDGPEYSATARCLHEDNCHTVMVKGSTPAAALLALAAALRAVPA